MAEQRVHKNSKFTKSEIWKFAITLKDQIKITFQIRTVQLAHGGNSWGKGEITFKSVKITLN